MMSNVTYKKLGELVNIRTGKLDANAADENGKYPFFTCATAPLHINTYSYDCECVLIAGNGDLNVKYYNGKFDAYQRTYIIEKKPEVDNILVYYIYHFFQVYIEVLRRGSIGGIIKYIKLGDLTNALIPVPSLEDQQRIVRELDAIHAILAAKNEQLRELDKLEGAIFYEMFGDPATNPKGWEIRKIADCCDAITGITYKPDDVDESGMIVLRSGNIQDGTIDYEDIVRVKKSIAEKYIIHEGDILMCSRNGSFKLVGKAAIIPPIQERMTWGAFMTVLRSECNPYVLAFLRSSAFRDQLTSAKTTTVNQITIGMLGKISMPYPPLDLQQAFASKISAIEQQKKRIRLSLSETEALLAARMQHYFD